MTKKILFLFAILFVGQQDVLAKTRALFTKVEKTVLHPTIGESLSRLLQKRNINTSDISQLSSLMRDKYNITKLEPDQIIFAKVINGRGNNLIEQIKFTKNPQEEIILSRNGNQFNAKLINKKNVKKHVIKIQDRISKNISELGFKYKLPKKVLDNITRVVGNVGPNTDIEFLIDVFQDNNEEILGYGDIQYISFKNNKKSKILYRYTTKGGDIKYIEPNLNTKSIEPMFSDPISGNPRISSKYGNRKDPISGNLKFHRGVDLAARSGTPIRATRDGYVKYIGLNGGYGKFIKISHDNNYETAYAHLSNYNNSLKVGSYVSKGQVIGYVGSTGKSTGPHLHYEIIHKNVHVDPINATRTLYVQNQSTESIEDIELQVAEINNKLTSATKAPSRLM